MDRASVARYEATLGPLVLTAWAAYTLGTFLERLPRFSFLWRPQAEAVLGREGGLLETGLRLERGTTDTGWEKRGLAGLAGPAGLRDSQFVFADRAAYVVGFEGSSPAGCLFDV